MCRFFIGGLMGRRALPKIDPSVNVDKHLSFVSELEKPFDPQSLFEKPQPLELEIGSGKGHFVLQHSQKNPDRHYLGNEIAKKYARFGAYRLAKHGVPNGHILSGDGLLFFKEFLPDQCADDVHVYFPDPWWKERHRRRRVMQPSFVSDVDRVLVSGGRLHFWTDVEQYFDETINLVADCSNFSEPKPVEPNVPEHDMDYQTHFERRMRMNAHDVYRTMFVKP